MRAALAARFDAFTPIVRAKAAARRLFVCGCATSPFERGVRRGQAIHGGSANFLFKGNRWKYANS
jgi:hypothetical protein